MPGTADGDGPDGVASAESFDQAASRYDSTGAQFAGPVAERLVDLAGLRSGDQVLDLGCGPGAVTIRAAQAVRPGGHVTGIDLSERMLMRLTAEAAGCGLDNVTARRGDASRPPVQAGRFDAVLASLVLYLLPGPQEALARWRELLVPGGVLAFSWGTRPDPRWSPVFRVVDGFAQGAEGFESYVRRLGRPPAMAAVLAGCGYTDITTRTETVEVRYTGPRQWWEASWAEAPRLAWRHIPAEDRAAARDDAFTLLEWMREPDGSLLRRVEMSYALAHRPAGRRRSAGPPGSPGSPGADR
jgi:SAM-dependent methyltransferase